MMGRCDRGVACAARVVLHVRNISTVSSEPKTMFLIVSTGCPALAPLCVAPDPSVAAA